MNKKKYESVMKSLSKYKTPKPSKLTKEQKEFLIACRGGDEVVPWETIADLWEEIGWRPLTESALRYHYRQIKTVKKV